MSDAENKTTCADVPLEIVRPTEPPIRLINGWRPIASAPKDGDEIDLFASGRRYTDCHWHCGEWLRWAYDTEDGPHHARVLNPTHWMRVKAP